MKLLFDENLSPRLVRQLGAEYPASSHVDLVGLHGQTDRAIWEHAARYGFTIVSKDDDFRALSETRGPPPQVIWLDVGNAGSKAIAELINFCSVAQSSAK